MLINVIVRIRGNIIPLEQDSVLFFLLFLQLPRTKLRDWPHVIISRCSDADNPDFPVRSRKHFFNTTQRPTPSCIAWVTIRTTLPGATLRFSSIHLFRVFSVARYSFDFIHLFQYLVMRSSDFWGLKRCCRGLWERVVLPFGRKGNGLALKHVRRQDHCCNMSTGGNSKFLLLRLFRLAVPRQTFWTLPVSR